MGDCFKCKQYDFASIWEITLRRFLDFISAEDGFVFLMETVEEFIKEMAQFASKYFDLHETLDEKDHKRNHFIKVSGVLQLILNVQGIDYHKFQENSAWEALKRTIALVEFTSSQLRGHDNGKLAIKVEDHDEENTYDLLLGCNEQCLAEVTDDCCQDAELRIGENSGIEKYSCDICQKKFQTKSHLNQHTRYVHGDETAFCKFKEKTFVCDWCPKAFTTSGKLNKHMEKGKCKNQSLENTVTETTKGDIKAELDSNCAAADENIKVEEEQRKEFICSEVECGQFFFKEGYLKMHMLHAHNKTYERAPGSNFPCEQCAKTFSTKSHLKRHLHNICGKESKAAQKEQEPCLCTVCGRSLASRRQLLKHMTNIHPKKTANDNEPSLCTICGKSFPNRGKVLAHINDVHNPQECSFCKKQFSNRTNLGVHIRGVHQGKRDIICHICGKCFQHKNHCQRHIETTHFKIRKFVCEICREAFLHKKDMKDHVRREHETVHLKPRPYKCEVCGKSFELACLKSTHVKSQHLAAAGLPVTSQCKKVLGGDAGGRQRCADAEPIDWPAAAAAAEAADAVNVAQMRLNRQFDK